jgi:hypothetical protein
MARFICSAPQKNATSCKFGIVHMIPTITAFEKLPDGSLGLALDTRVRWALEEAGQNYSVRGVSFFASSGFQHESARVVRKMTKELEGNGPVFTFFHAVCQNN